MKKRRLIIDTNLLLLLVVGAVEEGSHIKNSGRLGAFDKEDYDVVLSVMQQYDEIFITPYIATEVSNLIDLNGYAGDLAYEVARRLFAEFSPIHVSVNSDCVGDNFIKFGITDSSLINLAPNFDILTNDNRMLGPLYASSPDTIVPYYLAKQAYIS